MRSDVAATPRSAARAQRSLRWYPRAWRDRYGEEFCAHLEAEFEERPWSWRRGANVALHGIVTRLQFQGLLRWTVGVTGLAAVAVAAVLLVATELAAPSPPTLTATGGGGETFTADAPGATTITFGFSARPGTVLRILSVDLVGVPGFSLATVAGADFAPVVSGVINLGAWPMAETANLSLHTPVPAIGRSISLARHDTLFVGVRVSRAHHVYPVVGVKVVYLDHGHRFTTIILNRWGPIVVCAVATEVLALPSWCTVGSALASGVQSALHPVGATARAEPLDLRYVGAISQAAQSSDLIRQRPSTTTEMRTIAGLVDSRAADVAIESISLSRGVFRFAVHAGAGATRYVCLARDEVRNHAVIGYPPSMCPASSG